MNYCIDCGKKIVRKDAKRCRSCAMIHRWKNIKLPEKYCIDCKKKISKKAIRCSSCAMKLRIDELHPSYKHGKTHNNKCLNCGKHICFAAKRCNSCSMINKIKKGIVKMSGKNHPRYKDGTGRLPYSKDFTPKLKLDIRKRDKFRCKKCNMTEEEHLKKYNRVLEVHHIDHNRNNCKKSNLETRCKKCNLKNNTKQRS